jgi:uncharacterized protein YgfB (UPF0149 family)
MSQISSLPSYAVLKKTLHAFQTNAHAAQIHGLLCGYLCRTAVNKINSTWESFFPGIKKSKKLYQLLQEIIEASYRQLNEFSFEFYLILPTEKTNINLRAEALGLWCQGFLTGLDAEHISHLQNQSGEISEAIKDILHISEISFGDIAENEEDESAYVELVEYVRLSVLMIFQELKTSHLLEPKEENHNKQLH